MNDFFFARSLRAMSLAFHIAFAALGTGMPWLMVLGRGRGFRVPVTRRKENNFVIIPSPSRLFLHCERVCPRMTPTSETGRMFWKRRAQSSFPRTRRHLHRQAGTRFLRCIGHGYFSFKKAAAFESKALFGLLSVPISEPKNSSAPSINVPVSRGNYCHFHCYFGTTGQQ